MHLKILRVARDFRIAMCSLMQTVAICCLPGQRPTIEVMMVYRIDRIDFVGDTPQCSFQDGGRVHYIRKGVAFILKDEDENEFIAGPACAKRHTKDTNWGESVPDFTKGINRVAVEAHGGTKGPRGISTEDDNEDIQCDNDFAVSYLRLRMEKLADRGFFGARYEPFVPYYEFWKKHGALEGNARFHVESAERKIRQEGGKFHMERLQRCYATAFMIDVALRHSLPEKSRAFIASVRAQLARNYKLSDKQVATLSAIFSRLQDPVFERLELTAFP